MKLDGWVYVEDNTGKEVGYAPPDDYPTADHAMQGFCREYDDDFGVYFRRNGILNACTPESVPEDFA